MTTAVFSPATDYARKVVEGEIVAGKLVRLACQRHLNDIERSKSDPSWGYYFDDDAAQHAIDYFQLVLQLQEGEFAGKPFILQPFQQFKTGCLFGWKNSDGYRRFRYAYIEEGKGNGKSPWLGGIGLYMLTDDGEPGAEVYAAAVTRDQAKILFSDAEKMGRGSPDLAAELEFTVNNIAHPGSQSFFRAISAEARALDGKRVHAALIDELHEHPNAMVVDKMRAGTKNRRQALIVSITNSGYDRNSVCYQHHVYAQQILEGILENDEWFAFVAGLDACGAEGHTNPVPGCPNCDDWTDEAVWPKANPGLDTILPRRYLREQVAEALGMPSKLNIVLRLNFCIWTESANRWLDMDAWDQCADESDPMKLRSRGCWLGIDLSSTTDLTAAALVFEPDDDDVLDVLMYYWVPEDGLRKRVAKDRVPYDVWTRQGYIETTDGKVVDYDAIIERVKDFQELGYNIREIAMDPWNATATATKLMAMGFEVVFVRQGYASLNEPSKELERRVMAKTIRHGGNPVLRWNAANVSVASDPAGNIKPDKEHSTERIDGIAALVDALSRSIVSDDGISIYESQKLEAW